jgi:2-C-methyl-D-erythritol 2,4-cyclodiphosphate synthase
MMRIGEGWDVHALVPGRALVVGGVTIDHPRGLLGHSDADVLLHAITDALLGAAALGDIGSHFPDTDAQHRGADSLVLLREVGQRVRQAGFQIGNIDATIVAQAPRMAPHIALMRERIAQALGVAVGQVNVKAKTAEKLGPVGQGQSMEARAVALIISQA